MQGETRVHPPVTVSTFTQLFSPTPRGARLARRLVANRMDVWGYPYDGEANETVTLVVAELAANAVRHGRVRGRDFRVRLVLRGDVVRVEVTDAAVERLPMLGKSSSEGDGDDGYDEGGRGLVLVAALSRAWGVDRHPQSTYKTVWAEVPVPGRAG
jgi:anti-sigma regulatory factor (Ser/Thr protein kinase)